MNNTLTINEMHELARLGIAIRQCLHCNINDAGVPCHTDRLEAVRLMQRYLEIHNHTVDESK